MKFFKIIRFYFNLYFAFFKKHRKIILLGIVLGTLSFFLYNRFSPLLIVKKKKIGMVGKYNVQNLPLEIQKLISIGLTSVSPGGEISQGIAESWIIEEEGKIYTFSLKNNLFWHDGKPVKAGDINFNFSDVKTVVVDDKTIKFELKEPFSPFLSVVSKPLFKKNLIGVGDYKVKKIKTTGEAIEKIQLVSLNKKPKEVLEFRFYPTEESLKIAFKLGEIDVAKDLTDYQDFVNWKGIKITPEVKSNLFVALYFNTQNEKFSEKSTRQALSYAIKKEWKPRALSSYNFQSQFYNPNVKNYDYNLSRAKELLEKKPQEIEIATTVSLLLVAEKIKQDWSQLGIETKIKIISKLENEEAILITQEIPEDPDQYPMWHSTQKFNLSHLKNPRLDKLLEEGRKTIDKEKRKQIYFDFQRFLTEEAPAVFLFYPTLYTISRV
ncbi:MAG: ABC transporter substrate-binding protein [Microgenomates group bacterium]